MTWAEDSCDLLVIGGGPGGVTAALAAARRGMKVILAEARDLGGTCLNRGCIPTKLLLGGTAPSEDLDALAKLKLASGEVIVDLPALQQRTSRIIEGTRKALAKELEVAGVRLARGLARFIGPDSAAVACGSPDDGGDLAVDFRHCVLAAGAESCFPPGLAPDGQRILDSDQALELTEVPDSLAIVGGGVTGVELAQIFHRLGCKVTIVEAFERILMHEDPEVSAEAHKILKRAGVAIQVGAMVSEARSTDDGVELELKNGSTVSASRVLVVTGRRPVTAPLDPQAAGLTITERGYVAVDETLRASERIYAVGDVNGRTLLAHAADDQAHYAVNHLCGDVAKPYGDSSIPWCVYGWPETMRVGRLAHQLDPADGPVSTSRANLVANPIAQAHGQTQGFVKVIWQNERIQGVTAVGLRVAHLALPAAIMVRQHWTAAQARELIFPHPSLEETLAAAIRAGE